MPFIKRQDINPTLLKRFEGAHKARLRQALLDPGLTSAQRESIKEQLDQIGKPKVYKAGMAPKPGAVAFPDDK